MIFLHQRVVVTAAMCVIIAATVMLPSAAPALTDYSAGKTPEQLYNTDCSGCHPSPHGLAHALSAAQLASYLIRARATHSTVLTAENWFLKILWNTWRKVYTTSRWLIGQAAKLLHV